MTRIWINVVPASYAMAQHCADICLIYRVLVTNMQPNKHKTFVKHLHNDGPTSWTLVQHCINVIQKNIYFLIYNITALDMIVPLR